MRMRREFLAVLYVFILLLNDPWIVQAYGMNVPNVSDGLLMNSNAVIDPFMGVSGEGIHLVYELNGGINSNRNPEVLERENLPFTLDIPVREGYNFAGWYTDSAYRCKITEINRENAQNMVLFAKWTREIDNRYNVEMYSYRSGNVLSRNYKELKECSYAFLDDVKIPGMPSTREQDYLDNLISSEKKSHLSGIAYDGSNIWICHSNSRTLERIPYEYVQKIAEDAPGYCIDASALSDEYELKNTPSCITCYGGRVWVGTHTKIFGSEMLSYSYDEESDTLTAFSRYNIPSKVQGIAFDRNGQVYLSISYGRNNSSYLKVYTSLLSLTKHPDEPQVKVEMPPCSEEIAIADDNIYVVFESASRKYFEGTDGNGASSSPIDKVLEVTVASIW